MVAVYPSGIKTFSYREDYVEIVEAGDVNVSYDEIRAIQNTLGVNPQNETIDGKAYTWNNVNSRITAVRQGMDKPFVNVAANNIQIPYAVQTTIGWTSKTWDTAGIWPGGTQLICPRSGVYTFDIYLRWHDDAKPADNQQPVFNRSGELFIALTPVGGSGNTVNQGGYFPQGWQRSTHQSASMTVPWVKGTAVQMLAYQSCLTTPIVASAFMSATYHRDPPGPPFTSGISIRPI